MNISRSQEKILIKIKNFLEKNTKEKNNVFRLSKFYLCPFDDSYGYFNLIFMTNKLKGSIIFIKTIIKEIYKSIFLGEFEYINFLNKKKFEFIVVNWAYLKNFDKEGNYKDLHLNLNSKKLTNTLWYLIYMDENLPLKIAENVVLIRNSKKKFNLKFIFKIFKFTKLKDLLNFNFINEISYHSILSRYIYETFNKFVSPKLKKVLMPYEGQPFQNAIFKKVHEINNDIITVGFIHSFPSGLPANFFKREGHPKKIITTGESQAYCLNKYLAWDKKQIINLSSTRYLKSKKKDMSNKIYLPLNFNNLKIIYENFLNFVNIKKISLSNFKIQNHPSSLLSKKHARLIVELKKIISYSKKYEKKGKNFSIFIGPTASIIEAIERNLEVVHICENPLLESYNLKLWKYIKSKSLNNNIFQYKILRKNKLINFGNKFNLPHQYFAV